MVWAEFPFKLQLVVVKSIKLLIKFLSLFLDHAAKLFVQFVSLRANKLNENFFGLHFSDESRQLLNLSLDFSATHFYFLLKLHNILIHTLPQGLETFSRLSFRSLDVSGHFVFHHLDLIVIGIYEGQHFIAELV